MSRKDKQGRVLRKGEGQRKDGRYYYQYTDSMGKRHVVYGKDITELRRKENEINRNMLEGIRTDAGGDYTLNMMFSKYMEGRYLRETTYYVYNTTYDRYVRNTIGRKNMRDIHYSDIFFLYRSVLKEHNVGMGVIENIQKIINPLFEFALRDNIIRSNPCNKIIPEVKKNCRKQKGIRHALTSGQQKAFLEYVAGSPFFHKWTNLFTIAFGTGCRLGEIIGLTWDDLDYEKQVIRIRRTLECYGVYDSRKRNASQCALHVSRPKTSAGYRNIPMMEAVKQAFMSEYEEQSISGFNKNEIDGVSGFVFHDSGRMLHGEKLNRLIRRIVKAYNVEQGQNGENLLPDFTMHVIRHTFCTRLCENEANIKAIQSIMGHTNIKMTMDVYTDVSETKNLHEMLELEKKKNIF